jgi:hypothetical protein
VLAVDNGRVRSEIGPKTSIRMTTAGDRMETIPVHLSSRLRRVSVWTIRGLDGWFETGMSEQKFKTCSKLNFKASTSNSTKNWKISEIHHCYRSLNTNNIHEKLEKENSTSNFNLYNQYLIQQKKQIQQTNMKNVKLLSQLLAMEDCLFFFESNVKVCVEIYIPLTELMKHCNYLLC